MSTLNNRQIVVDELDFDSIKGSLKYFLQGQSNFSDYEFEGSALSVLLDILAYNTHYNSLYTNFAVNEMFIDSASKLSSVTSLAKTIGYTPKSALAAKAIITLYVSNVSGNPATLTIPKNTKFRSEVNGVDFIFTVPSAKSTTKNVDNTYTFSNLELIQGEALSQYYIASDTSNYIIPNNMVDMTRVSVKVYENNNTSLFTVFTLADDVLKIKDTDAVYFVKQREDLYYEIVFGNDAIGKAIDNGNRVVIDYYTTKGDAANGCRSFFYAGGWVSDYFFDTVTTTIATDGALAETRDSIKYNAPRFYKTQHRAVTSDDYEAILREKYPLIESIKVWGGEENIPPVYGKVFISAKPITRSRFTVSEKSDMVAWIRGNRSVLSIVPEFVDAYVLNVEVMSTVTYNPSQADVSATQIKSYVVDTITTVSEDLNQFNASLLHSELSRLIDNSHSSVVSNTTKFRVRTSVTPTPGIEFNYIISQGNKITNTGRGGNVWSTRFYDTNYTDRVYIRDEPNGEIWLYTEDSYGTAYKQRNVGSVNYATGAISFTVNFRDYFDSAFEVVFEPSSFDIVGVNNYIVSIPMDLVQVEVVTNTSKITTNIR